jgi:uncharacterized protein (DUF1499 family)
MLIEQVDPFFPDLVHAASDHMAFVFCDAVSIPLPANQVIISMRRAGRCGYDIPGDYNTRDQKQQGDHDLS